MFAQTSASPARPVRSRASVCRNTRRRRTRRAVARAAASPPSAARATASSAGAQSNGASSVASEVGVLVRSRGEHLRRVAAVGESGREIGRIQHRGSALQQRQGSSVAADQDPARGRRPSATMRQSTPLCLPCAPIFALPARLVLALVRLHPERHRRRICGVCARVAAGPLRRVSACRVVSRYVGVDPARASSDIRSRSRHSRPDGTAGIRSSSIEGFRVLDRAGSEAMPLLELPEIGLIVAWTSLPLLELRLKELVIERPRLAIRRDRAGVAPRRRHRDRSREQMTAESPLTDWMLRQREIVIRDALITWDDDLRNAPQLVLDRVQFRLESGFGRHRFGLRGTPPAELAAPIDVRGDLRGISIKDWQHADGDLFVRLDYADVAAWREWLPLPSELVTGKGALRMWFQIAAGRGARRRRGSRARRRQGAARGRRCRELDLAHLSGRVGWRSGHARAGDLHARAGVHDASGARARCRRISAGRRDVDAERHRRAGQHRIRPAAARVRSRRSAPTCRLPERHARRARARSRRRERSPRADCAGRDPRTRHVHYSAQRPNSRTSVSSRRNAMPGARGLTGQLRRHSGQGEIKFRSATPALALPRVFDGPIALDSLQSEVRWERRDGRPLCSDRAVRIRQRGCRRRRRRAPIGTSGAGPRRGRPHRAGVTRGRSRAGLSLHAACDRRARAHLAARALVKGGAADARFKLAGNLADFPFANGKGGQFVVTGKAQGVTLDYAEGWPAIDGIDARYPVRGHADDDRRRARARSLGVDIGKHARGDRRSSRPLRRSPRRGRRRPVPPAIPADSSRQARSRDWTGHRRPGGAAGDGRRRADARASLLPTRRIALSIGGEFTFAERAASICRASRASRKSTARFAFTRAATCTAREITARDAGRPGEASSIAHAPTDGVACRGSGTVNLAAVRREYPIAVSSIALSGTHRLDDRHRQRGGASTWTLRKLDEGRGRRPSRAARQAGRASRCRCASSARDDAGRDECRFIDGVATAALVQVAAASDRVAAERARRSRAAARLAARPIAAMRPRRPAGPVGAGRIAGAQRRRLACAVRARRRRASVDATRATVPH